MGYNGSNGKRSRRGYKGFPKSSVNFGSRITFGKKGIVTGLFKAADTIINSKPPQSSLHNFPPTDLSKTDSDNADTGISTSTIILIIVAVIAGILIIAHAPLLLILLGIIALGGLFR